MMVARKNRGRRPELETLDGRQLLSGLLVALQAEVPHLGTSQIAAIASGETQVAAKVVANASNASGVYIGNQGAGNPIAGVNLPGSPLLGAGTPTAAELAREKFHAKFSGPSSILPGRFSDQKQIIYLKGLGGSTPNFFLHGDYGLAIVIPTDPTQPTTGFAFLDDKNNNSGGVVGLDLVADPTSFDAKGRPTRLTFTADPNIYGGIFYVDSALGTVHITYGKNTATSVFDGRIYTSGLTSPFQNTSLYAKHSG